MKTEFRGVSLSLIDFMGALLPGLVWFLLIAATIELQQKWSAGLDLGPWHTASRLLTGDPSSVLTSGITIVLVGLLLGYVIKPNVMSLVELTTRFEAWFSKPRSDFRFPYRSTHSERGYFTDILSHLEDAYPEDWEELSGHQPFTICKRIVKSVNPVLWQECEYREAELRFIGSLFLAALFSFIIAGIALWSGAPGRVSWLFCSLTMVVLLAYVFRRRREREVGYTYLLFLVATRATSER